MKKIINTLDAPAAIGPYSQGVAAGQYVFTSGQLPIRPDTGVFAGNSIEEQTWQSLKNVCTVLECAGCRMDGVIKVTVFLKNIEDFAAMNKVYSEFFPEGSYPARSAIEVARLPKDALIEIEAIAVRQNR